ncbi:hypothetical protein KM043_003306 [Ampulex compressa]|nr:hypothetical protein KM043_003306 [Ampulex compressa]
MESREIREGVGRGRDLVSDESTPRSKVVGEGGEGSRQGKLEEVGPVARKARKRAFRKDLRSIRARLQEIRRLAPRKRWPRRRETARFPSNLAGRVEEMRRSQRDPIERAGVRSR